MKEKIVKISKISNLVLSWFNFFMFFAMRCCWSGISKTLGYNGSSEKWFLYWLPVMVWGVLMVIFIANLLLYLLLKKGKVWSYILNGVNILFLIVILVIIKLGAIDYMEFVWPEFFTYLGLTAAVLAGIFIFFIYPKTTLAEKKWFKYSLLGVSLVVICINIFNVSFNSISTEPVVYIVGEEYQILFSSRVESRAWVTIVEDGEEVRYFDNYNGSNRSNEKIHKVCIPMEKLDQAKAYEIHVQKVNYRGPFGGFMGRDISASYNFIPVDTSDGFQYYNLSDIHMNTEASIKAQSYYDYDLLVLAGDLVSMMDTYDDANYVNEIAHRMTKGTKPVVYARGNHEIKGKIANELHKFVGADGEKFYYTFKVADVYGVVLDMGEDHDDDFWEFYDTAQYTKFREEQFKMLEAEIASGDYANYKYQLVVCHIPPVFVNYRKDHVYEKKEFTRLLNQMGIDMCISGHQHDLYVFEPGHIPAGDKLRFHTAYDPDDTYSGYLTDHNFVNILVSKRGHTQTEEVSSTYTKSHIGAFINVDFTKNEQTITYNTSDNDLVYIVNPFISIKDEKRLTEKEYGEKIVFKLN